MKFKKVQKQGLIGNQLLVYLSLKSSEGEGHINGSENYVAKDTPQTGTTKGLNRKKGLGLKIETLKRVTQLLITVYILFKQQFLMGSNTNSKGLKGEINISLKDGKIKITEGKKILSIFIKFKAGLIIYNQNNYNQLEGKGNNKSEPKYILLLTNLLGINFLLKSNDWVLTIVSWELFNKTLYLLVSLKSESEAGQAASLKYFVLSALSTTFLLQGVCILYFKTGSTNYEIIETSIRELSRNDQDPQKFIQVALILILMTLLFKLSAAPFYQWAPDLYENIETKITKWKIIIPKLAVLSFLYLLTTSSPLLTGFNSLSKVLLITGSQSLIIGSVSLNNQWYIKRFFAYSGISHIGFMLLALYCLENQGFIIYMVLYGITTLNFFIIFIILSEFKGRDLKMIQDLSGIFKFNPALSLAFALNLFSLAGVCLLFFYIILVQAWNFCFNFFSRKQFLRD